MTGSAGNSVVYRSEFAGTNQASAVTWFIDEEMPELVSTLKERGVVFEHYSLPGMRMNGDIHVAEGMQAAWFKDPDGNIHALVREG